MYKTYLVFAGKTVAVTNVVLHVYPLNENTVSLNVANVKCKGAYNRLHRLLLQNNGKYWKTMPSKVSN